MELHADSEIDGGWKGGKGYLIGWWDLFWEIDGSRNICFPSTKSVENLVL